MNLDPGRCNAINRVTFAIEQDGNKIGGIYTCQFGNYICRNMNENGNIVAGNVTGRRVSLRVFIPDDGSSCIFGGTLSGQRIDGGYTCMQGGGLVDKGKWHIERPP